MEILEQPGAVKPERVRFFRGQMQTIISRALTELQIKPLPSRRCFALIGAPCRLPWPPSSPSDSPCSGWKSGLHPVAGPAGGSSCSLLDERVWCRDPCLVPAGLSCGGLGRHSATSRAGCLREPLRCLGGRRAKQVGAPVQGRRRARDDIASVAGTPVRVCASPDRELVLVQAGWRSGWSRCTSRRPGTAPRRPRSSCSTWARRRCPGLGSYPYPTHPYPTLFLLDLGSPRVRARLAPPRRARAAARGAAARLTCVPVARMRCVCAAGHVQECTHHMQSVCPLPHPGPGVRGAPWGEGWGRVALKGAAGAQPCMRARGTVCNAPPPTAPRARAGAAGRAARRGVVVRAAAAGRAARRAGRGGARAGVRRDVRARGSRPGRSA